MTIKFGNFQARGSFQDKKGNMNEWLLTEEEAMEAVRNWMSEYPQRWIGIVRGGRLDLVTIIAEAQVKKMMEWIEKELNNSDEFLEIGRKAIEDVLIEWRDGRLSEFNRGNGLVIKEKNGEDSSIIRFGPETALRIGLKVIWQSLKKELLKEEK